LRSKVALVNGCFGQMTYPREMVSTETAKPSKDLSMKDKLTSIVTVDNAIEKGGKMVLKKGLDFALTKLPVDAPEPLQSALQTLEDSSPNISISDKMLETALDKGLDFAIKTFAPKTPEQLQSTIYHISSFAAAEFLQLVGIGTGFAGLNMTMINQKLDQLNAKVDTIMGAPAKQALYYLRCGMQSLKAKKNVMANKEFEEVRKLAITGRTYEKENIQTVANLTKYLIVADLMTCSFDEDQKMFCPYRLLCEDVKMLIKIKVTDHLQKLLDVQIKQEPGYFSLSKQKKKGANQNVVDGVLQNALQFVCPPGSPVPVKFIPEGFEDTALLNLDGKPGKLDSSSIYIWRNSKKVMIHHGITAKTSEIDTKEEDELTIVSNASGVSRDGRPLAIMDNSKQSRELIDASKEGNNAKALLMSGADVNAVDTLCHTPLINASLKGYSDVVTTLLNHPLIQIDIQDVVGYTALHYAALNGNLNVVKQLVTAGADLTLVEDRGMTPAQAAKAMNKHDVYNYLSNL